MTDTTFKVMSALFDNHARRAIKYISPSQVIRATRRLYGGRILRGNVEILVTIGKPNYLERKFIRQCKKAGEPFPVKKIQLHFPKKK